MIFLKRPARHIDISDINISDEGTQFTVEMNYYNVKGHVCYAVMVADLKKSGF